ncbi:MAG: hypothetical protein OHK0036_16050 [Bacteroidia bacterium]
MDFQQRLKLYMIGFLIGLLLVYVMFGNRSCVSLSEVKMNELKNQRFKTTEEIKEKLNCIHKSPTQLKLELEFFEVNFDKSQPREKPCRIYYLEPRKHFKKFYPYHLIIKDCDNLTLVTQIIFQNNTQCP